MPLYKQIHFSRNVRLASRTNVLDIGTRVTRVFSFLPVSIPDHIQVHVTAHQAAIVLILEFAQKCMTKADKLFLNFI